MALRAPAERIPLLTGGVAALALVAAVVNAASAVGFPAGAVIEGILNAVVTLELLGIAVGLAAATVVAVRRRRADFPRPTLRPSDLVIDERGMPVSGDGPRPSPMAFVGVVLIAGAWAIWLVFSASGLLFALASEARASYFSAISGIAFSGLLWVLGTVFGALGAQRDGDRRNRMLSAIATGAGVALMIPAVGLSLAFASGALG